ncbi:MAG: hypothetical protein RL186_891 [Pseudomonadota bacterium]|jgi:hypothetical protein
MTPEQAILELIAAAKPGRTIHPTDAARAMYQGKEPDGWMTKMTAIRHAAIHLARQGQIGLYRKGKITDPNSLKGVYRLGPPPTASDAGQQGAVEAVEQTL